MQIHRTGPNIALYIDGAEVAAKGWGELDETRLRSITDEALGTLGLAELPPREIESYAAADGGALVFVRIQEEIRRRETFYAFDDADAMLDALAACGFGTRDEGPGLYFYSGQYILALDKKADRPPLCEFGARLRAGALFRAVLEEHGEVLSRLR